MSVCMYVYVCVYIHIYIYLCTYILDARDAALATVSSPLLDFPIEKPTIYSELYRVNTYRVTS